jgi:hypothetical protein
MLQTDRLQVYLQRSGAKFMAEFKDQLGSNIEQINICSKKL